MQLKNRKVKSALFAASCTLLAGNVNAQDWNIETAVMYYGESDRVQAVEGIAVAKKTLEGEKDVSVKVVVDSLTGSSANGAVPQQDVQTFSSPSGNKEYEIAGKELPLDSTFKDTRVQLSGQWTQPLGENYTVSTGANISREYDYTSFSMNGVVGRYLNTKNTTLSMGLNYSFDIIDAVGGRPVGLSTMVVKSDFADEDAYRAAYDLTRQSGGDDTKTTLDLVFGLTQVINRKWITQFNLGLSEVDGYLTDPYKVVSVVDDTGLALSQQYESRPDTRSKQSFYAQSKYHFGKSVWDVSYRFNNDDWGIQSHTIESRFRFLFANNSYLEPHVRYYQQGEADFYTPFFFDSDVLPEHASADYRIGKLNAYTLGLRYGKKLNSGHEYGVRLEYYNQAPQDVGVEAPGQLQDLDLYPSLDAIVVQFDYKF